MCRRTILPYLQGIDMGSDTSTSKLGLNKHICECEPIIKYLPANHNYELNAVKEMYILKIQIRVNGDASIANLHYLQHFNKKYDALCMLATRKKTLNA